MTRSLALTACLILQCFFINLHGKSGQDQKTGGCLTINVDPEESEIYLDGDFLGKGTVSLDKLSFDRTYLVEVRKRSFQSAKRSIQLKQGSLTIIDVVLRKPPARELESVSHNSPSYQLTTPEECYLAPVNLKKDVPKNKEFNEAMVMEANQRARETADAENQLVMRRLASVNKSVAARNQDIRRNNAAWEKERKIEVTHTLLNSSSSDITSGTEPEPVIQVALAPVAQSNTDPILDEATYTEAKEQNLTGKQRVTITAAYSTTATTEADNSSSNVSKPVTAQFVTSKTDDISMDVKENPPSQNMKSSNAKTPAPPEPLTFSLEESGEVDGLVYLIVKDNKSVDYDKSSATVLVTDDKGLQNDFSSTYSGGVLQFYPFSGVGTYTVRIQIEIEDNSGTKTTQDISDIYTIESPPKSFFGNIQRIVGSYAYAQKPETISGYPGQEVNVYRLDSGKLSEIATGNLTNLSGEEWTIELSWITEQPEFGDLILVK